MSGSASAVRSYVTVVAGLPRSGTSMMMRMLEAGGLPVLTDGARRADEDNPRGYYELEAVKRTGQDASWLPRARGMAVKMVYRLLRELPAGFEYRVLLMTRTLSEVHASQETMLERSQQGGASMALEEFEQVFRSELRRIRTWLSAQPGFQTLTVDYNAMLEEPRPQLARVCEFLGDGLDADAMSGIVEPDLYRQRKARV